MNRRLILSGASALAVLAAMAALSALAGTSPPQVQVFKSKTCGCCGAWVEHLRSAGFAVTVTDVDNTSAARKRLGMPERFGSCHTATVGGYVLEGHVPASEVKRLLAQKTKALGLAVAGMPAGSPGMETGGRLDPYKILLIDHAGRKSVYASYPK